MLLTLWLQSFFFYPPIGMEMIFLTYLDMVQSLFFHSYCLARTCFFGTDVSRAEN